MGSYRSALDRSIYHYCGRCNATYFGETCWHLIIRVGELSGVSLLTGKKLKSKKSTPVKDHMLFCDHIVSINDFKILATSYSDFHVKAKESLDITWWTHLKQKWNVTFSLPIWLIPPIWNYILMIFITVTVIVLI